MEVHKIKQMNSKKFFGTLLFVAFLAVTGFSQKFGHVNVGNLLDGMPQTKAADEQLVTYRDQLIAAGQQDAQKVQTEFEAFMKRVDAGGVTPKEQQEKQTYFQNKQQELVMMEQDVIQKVAQKREELLKPLLTNIDNAIREVGKENDFTFIFDSSMFNTVLFAQESADVTALVKAKL